MPSTSAKSPDSYDDPLGLDDQLQPTTTPAQPQPVVTGLSDEEDAARHLALRFDTTLGFCRNCEGTYSRDTTADDGALHHDGVVVMTTRCPHCLQLGIGEFLYDIGTPPYRAKQKR